MDSTTILIGIFTLILLEVIVIKATKSSKKKPAKEKGNYLYQKKSYLLTKNEAGLYQQLLPIARSMQLTICPKVRLADIIEPRKNQNWQAAFYRIQAKHIDFVLCTNPLTPILAIELDDKSHEREDRKERDQFVNQAMESAQLPILHLYDTKNLKQKIEEKLQFIRK